MTRATGVLEVLLAGVFFGTIPIFSAFLHRLDVSPFQQAFFRFLISLLVLVWFVLFRDARYKAVRIPNMPLFLVYGFFLTVSFLTYMSSIALGTPVGKAVFLSYTQPFFAILLGWLFLGERITRMKAAAAFVSVMGAALILQVWTISSSFFLGDLLALLNGLFYASFIITGRHIRTATGHGHFATTFWSFVFGLLWLLPLWAFAATVSPDAGLVGFSLGLPVLAWFFLLCLAVLSTLLPYFLLNLGLKEVKASRAGILLLVEPVVVVLLGVLLLNETLGFWQVAGGMLILLSVIIVNRDVE